MTIQETRKLAELAGMFMAVKQSENEARAKQQELITQRFPDFGSLGVEYTEAEYAEMDALVPEALITATKVAMEAADSLINPLFEAARDHLIAIAPTQHQKAQMLALMQTIESSADWQFGKHRVIAWALSGFKSDIPDTHAALKVLSNPLAVAA